MAGNDDKQDKEMEIVKCGGIQMDKDEIVRLVIRTVKEELAKEGKNKYVEGNDRNGTDEIGSDGRKTKKQMDNGNDNTDKLHALQVAYNTLQIECTWYKAEYKKLKEIKNNTSTNKNTNNARAAVMDEKKPPTDAAQTQAMKRDEKKLSIIIHGVPEKEDKKMEKTVSNILNEAD